MAMTGHAGITISFAGSNAPLKKNSEGSEKSKNYRRMVLFSSRFIQIMSENSIIQWKPDFHIEWSDFKAESNPAVFEDSRSVIKYRFTWTVNSEIIDEQIVFFIEDITIFVEFHPLLSWVRISESDDDLLKHEQGSFDLAELTMRENIKKLQDMFYSKHFPTRGQNIEQRKQFAKEDSGKMIVEEVNKMQQLYEEKHKKYQEETDFGRNKAMQSKYDLIFEQLR